MAARVNVCVAFKAHMGWVNAVAVRAHRGPLACMDARRVSLGRGDDREVMEPYHLAGGWNGLVREPRPPDPAVVIRRGRQRQAQAARSSLAAYRDDLAAAGLIVVRAVLLTGRGRLGDLERVLASHASIHVAEGEAIRDATRRGLAALDIATVEQDEKDVPALAAAALDADDPDAVLKAHRPAPGVTWRREERLLALAAWLHRRG